MPKIKPFFVLSCVTALALAIFLGSTLARAQGATFTVGVVDIRKAIDDSKQGREANKKLQTKYDSLKKGLDAKQAELEKKRQDLSRQANTLSQEALEKRSQDLMAEVANFREQAEKATADMQKAYADALEPLSQKAQKIIAEIARARGFAIVLDSSAGTVMFVDPQYNITAEVTKRLDASK
ncbi:MAG: OmpH family outer membrane protein [Deltaproteobacteria bacterium]|jgi:outer membrane protein|nr:OmpH family outer membrane protein [Deltaproteobacteria bacterium]